MIGILSLMKPRCTNFTLQPNITLQYHIYNNTQPRKPQKMGTFVATILQEGTTTLPENSYIYSEPLIKIKQYHGMFKYVCDSFIISLEQSKEIFGALYGEKMKIWDPEQQGKIDALEIFCGLILFSREATLKKKLSFLFSIFDFNQIKSLSFIDVQVIILNMCNSVYKILGQNGKVNEHQIAEWLAQYLNKRERVKITQLYRLCLENVDIRQFFIALNRIIEEPIDFPGGLDNVQEVCSTKQMNKYEQYQALPINSQKQKQQIEQNLQFHRELISKIIKIQDPQKDHIQYERTSQHNNYNQNNYGCRINWVYGINISGISRPFIVLDRQTDGQSQGKGKDESILYRIGAMAVVQNLAIGKQSIVEDEREEISCLAYSRRYGILATVQKCQFPSIKLYKKSPSQSPTSPHTKQYTKYGTIPTHHQKGVQLLQFILKDTLLASVGSRQHDSPILIYDIFRLEVMYQIVVPMVIRAMWNPFVMIERSDVGAAVIDSFYVLGFDSTVFEVVLKGRKKSRCPNPNYQLHSHSYRQQKHLNSPITACLTCYTNINNPHLHSYKDKSATLAILTGHECGSLFMLTPYSKCKEKQEEVITELDGPVHCLQITRDIFVVGAGACLYVYDWEVLASRVPPIYKADLRSITHVELLGTSFRYFDFVQEYILAMTDKGQFLKLQTKRTTPPSYKLPTPEVNPLPEELLITPVTRVTKFEHTASTPNIFCLLEVPYRNPSTQLLLLSTNNNKIISINTATKQIEDVWEINAVQNVVALDAVCSEDGVCYVICACRSGRLYIRIDWEDSPKFYDCASEIVDAKISKDCSYLLVATKNNYLLFFAQINSTFTSPRKLLFEYETPCCINFLDNYKFFLVTTSAKNSYLIEIPQLKHKKLQKESQKISVSRLNVRYPYNSSSSKQDITYSNGCIGGCMKFSLLAMKERDIYFFPNSNALERGNYAVLNTHKCPVLQIMVNEEQNRFFTLGKNDDALIEWEVFDTKFHSKKGVQLDYLDNQEMYRSEFYRHFQQLQEFAINKMYLNDEGQRRNISQTYFFKGTKLQKLNEQIQKFYPSQLISQQQQQNRRKFKQKAQTIIATPSCQQLPTNQNIPPKQKQFQSCTYTPIISPEYFGSAAEEFLAKRCPNISLRLAEVYGYEIQHKNSLSYCSNGTEMLGFSSRFIIRTNLKTRRQTIHEPTRSKITYLLKNEHDGQILFSVVQEHPRIHILGKGALRTTHHGGIIHMAVWRTCVLSYAKGEKTGYSINLHDYGTGQLLTSCSTDVRVSEFIMVNQHTAVSLNQVRIWSGLYPSEPIILASSGCLLPNGKDILLGLYDGKFAILSSRGLFQLNNQAHEKAIDLISIRHSSKYLERMASNRNLPQSPHKQKQIDQNFQIISISRDEKIKIWTSNFQAKLLIFFRQKSNINFFGQNNKQLLMLDNIYAKSINVYQNRILIAFNTCHIVEIELEELRRKEAVAGGGDGGSGFGSSEKSMTDPSIVNLQIDGQNEHSNSNQLSLSASNPNYQTHTHTTNSLDPHPQSPTHTPQLSYKWTNITQLHSPRSRPTLRRRTFFSINSTHHLLATSAQDNQIIVHDYERNTVVYKCYYEGVKVECVRFCNRGTLLAIGFDSGEVRLYQFKLCKHQQQHQHPGDKKDILTLKLYQKLQLKMRKESTMGMGTSNINGNNSGINGRGYGKSMGKIENCNFCIINMQFSPCDTFLAISYLDLQEGQKKYQSYISIFKTKQSSSTMTRNASQQKQKQKQSKQMESQEQFYFLIDMIEISGNGEQIVQSKYVKSVYFMNFYSEKFNSSNNNGSITGNVNKKNVNSSGLGTRINTNNNITANSQFHSSSQQSQLHQNSLIIASSSLKNRAYNFSTTKNQIYLIIYEQYLDHNKIRLHNDNKIKIKVYLIEDKLIYREDYNVNFLMGKFPCFVNGYVNRVPGSGGLKYMDRYVFTQASGCRSNGGYGKKDNEVSYPSNIQEKKDSQLTITAMLISNNTIYYGDSTGKIHIVKLSSLLNPRSPQSQPLQPQPQSQPQQQNREQLVPYSSMNLSKVYNSHISFINAMEISEDGKWLFVSGGVDDCVVKYRIEMEGELLGIEDTYGRGNGNGIGGQLDSIAYPLEFKDVHDQYLTKSKFYEFLNNIDPIRDEISDIMLDVEDSTLLGKNNKDGVQLKPMRIFGRRAFDKRNNLYQDYRGYLIYTLGPNIIVQDPADPLKQTHIPIDPNPYSNSPQISCLSMSKQYLIASTEQQNSRILVWDIFSKTCLSEVKLKNFSIVYHMAQSSTHKLILIYGINKLYESSMQLLNWQDSKILGNVSLMYSGCWKIKDICEVYHKDNGMEFVSCGVRHLGYWQYVGESLVCSSFGLESQQLCNVTFMVARTVLDMLVVGGQNGSLYLFKNFEYLSEIKVHSGPIRALTVDYDWIYSGGMDGCIGISTILVDENGKEILKKVQQYSIKNKTTNTRKISGIATPKQSKLKRCHSLEVEQHFGMNNSEIDLILAQEDIQSIVIVKNNKSFAPTTTAELSLYVGTRSGNILLMRSQGSEQQRLRRNMGTSNNIYGSESIKAICRRSQALYPGQEKNNSLTIETLIHGHDNDTIASLCFNENQPDLFYILTCSGALQIWSLRTLRRLYLYKLAQQVTKIFCFKQYIIIVCERSIRTIRVDLPTNSINYITQMSKQYDGIITDCCMSKICADGGLDNSSSKEDTSQKESAGNSNVNQSENARKKGAAYLVIGLKKSQFNEIIINEISNKIQEKFVVVNLKYEIEFMDFSRDCRYLLFKDSFQELGMVNLLNYKRINTIFVQMGTEWQSQGVRISPHGQRIYCSYSRENKITVLRRIGEKQIVIGDQMGTLRIFEYPCPEDKLGQLHSECYTTHMNFIKNIEIHATQQYALTSAVYDRSLILWEISKAGSQSSISY